MSDKECPIRERDALAHTAPSAISVESDTILSRSVASVIGGRPPICSPGFRMASTYSRVSASGLPTLMPSREWVGAWVTPIPSRNRPSPISWM